MSVAKNYLYNVFYQLLMVIIPIITVPYVAKVLGTYGTGVNAYSFSISQYFVLFGMIGVSLYGNRTIATVREDNEKLNKKFWEIYILQLITCSMATFIYIIYVFSFVEANRNIYLAQSLYIISAAIDISWLFMGLEDFKKTVTRNTVIKIIGVICIFTFVKSIDDLLIYVGILAVSNFLGQLVLWGYVGKIIDFKYIKLIKFNEMIKNLNPMIILFVPQIAVQIYTVLNKTMLGIISTESEVGIFDNSEKIIKITLAIVTSLGTVMLPRISNEFSKGKLEKVNDYIYKSLNFVSIIAVPMVFGIATISKEFVGWFLTDEFYKSTIVIPILSPIIIFIAWSNVLGVQYLLPAGRNKDFTLSVTIGAIINLILNFFFIRKFQSIGAGISTVISELSVTVIQIYILRKELNILNVISEILKYISSGLVMGIVVRIIGNALGISIFTTMLQIFVGGIVYIILLIFLKSTFVKEIYDLLGKRFRNART